MEEGIAIREVLHKVGEGLGSRALGLYPFLVVVQVWGLRKALGQDRMFGYKLLLADRVMVSVMVWIKV